MEIFRASYDVSDFTNNFSIYDDIFVPSKHYIELADNSRTNGVVKACGNAKNYVNNYHKYFFLHKNSKLN